MNWFRGLGLQAKMLITVGLSCVICGVIALGTAIYFNDKEFRNGLIEKSRTIHSRLDVAAKYVATQGGLKPMVERYTQKYKDSSELSDDDKNIIIQQVPIYAAMKIGAENAEKELYNFRVFSNEPRKKENQATPEEMTVFNKFEGDSNLKELVIDDGKIVTVYRPVRLKERQGCFNCHGDPATSPWGNGRDILGYKMENWKDGKLHGVFAISNDIAAVKQAQAVAGGISATTYLGVFIAAGAALALLLAVFIVRGPVNVLNQIATVLSASGAQVSSAANQIASSSQELSQATTEQAASLEETASAIQELSSMVEKNSDNAQKTASSSSQSQHKAQHGQEVVEQMIHAMADINQSNNDIMEQINQSNSQIAEIVHVIRDIGEKTKVINDIVFQTKLLSFNASVEAARAGEHGKGFAVVAQEIGTLAQMSGNAAKEISSLLNGSIQKVESIINDTKTKVEHLVSGGRSKVASGTEVARQCGEVLREIVNNVASVSQMAVEISTASQEQASGVNEINQAVGQLDQVTQKNADTSHSAASAAEELSAQAKSLREAVERLVTTVQGVGGAQTAIDESDSGDMFNHPRGRAGRDVASVKRAA